MIPSVNLLGVINHVSRPSVTFKMEVVINTPVSASQGASFQSASLNDDYSAPGDEEEDSPMRAKPDYSSTKLTTKDLKAMGLSAGGKLGTSKLPRSFKNPHSIDTYTEHRYNKLILSSPRYIPRLEPCPSLEHRSHPPSAHPHPPPHQLRESDAHRPSPATNGHNGICRSEDAILRR
jgi:hypothetical protein